MPEVIKKTTRRQVDGAEATRGGGPITWADSVPTFKRTRLDALIGLMLWLAETKQRADALFDDPSLEAREERERLLDETLIIAEAFDKAEWS